MIILWIILWIVIIAAFVGLIALVMELFTKSNSHRPYGPYERFIKRFLDAFLSTGALIVFSPILLITAILVRIKLGSPVLFTQDRRVCHGGGVAYKTFDTAKTFRQCHEFQ